MMHINAALARQRLAEERLALGVALGALTQNDSPQTLADEDNEQVIASLLKQEEIKPHSFKRMQDGQTSSGAALVRAIGARSRGISGKKKEQLDFLLMQMKFRAAMKRQTLVMRTWGTIFWRTNQRPTRTMTAGMIV